MSQWSRPTISAAHQALCEAVVALAEAAAARRVAQDVELGYLQVDPEPLQHLNDLGLSYLGKRTAVIDAWDRAAAERPRSPLALLRHYVQEPEEVELLALSAAPHLERRIARAYRRLEPDRAEMTAGLLFDLASPRATGRLRLATFLHPDGVLRRLGLLSASSRQPISSETALAVAPALLGLMRGEPLVAGAGTRMFSDPVSSRMAAAILDVLALPRANPVQVTVLVGSRRVTHTAARLVASAEACVLWLVTGAGTPATGEAWVGLLRDAMLAGAIPAIAGARLGDPDVRQSVCSAVHRTQYPVLALVDVEPPPIDPANPEVSVTTVDFGESAALHATVAGAVAAAGGVPEAVQAHLALLGLVAGDIATALDGNVGAVLDVSSYEP